MRLRVDTGRAGKKNVAVLRVNPGGTLR